MGGYYSNEQRRKHKAQVRRLMVLNPDITVEEMANSLNYSYNYVMKIRNKIDVENAKYIERQILSKDLAKISELTQEAIKDLLTIAKGKGVAEKDRNAAWKEINNQLHKLLDAKFNAGVYQRNLGKVDVNNVHTLIDLVIVSNEKTNNAGGRKELPEQIKE